MTTEVATDTFTAFVDVLIAALDPSTGSAQASGLSAEEIAGRLHLSRFHLDRIVSQTAGEPPRRFRRRILLERAAYRLLSSDRSILDIAVEAGYGSHEAFTRAFASAYGEPPAAWRSRPREIRIEAPSGVHFHPPGSIRLPSRDEVTAMELLTRMVEHHVWLTGEILARATRLTDDQLDEPIQLSVEDDPDPASLRRLLSRLIGQMGMWNAALANREYDWSVEEHESLTSMRRRLAEEGPTYLRHVHEVVDEGRLDDTFVDALCDPAEVFTYGGMIAHVLTFAAHRRTLAVLALDRHGITELGWGDPMRWVAEPAG
ncbi:helix-turn-helix transcriptional regulator [Nocardioides terrisoli]|uniref:helix-turn-helix transcriptional regulator n=1 Tax=Nocardioides terrisoli TaxID=3388267 RepID=UPI00287B96CB|nr:helix-turn-helix transcriptional regulator [Nocardioides marmorisolisilvae]